MPGLTPGDVVEPGVVGVTPGVTGLTPGVGVTPGIGVGVTPGVTGVVPGIGVGVTPGVTLLGVVLGNGLGVVFGLGTGFGVTCGGKLPGWPGLGAVLWLGTVSAFKLIGCLLIFTADGAAIAPTPNMAATATVAAIALIFFIGFI